MVDIAYGWTPTELAWRKQAACVGFVDLFFPETATRATRLAAIRICDSCPVTTECGDYANETGEKLAIWGGVNRTKLFRRNARLAASGHV